MQELEKLGVPVDVSPFDALLEQVRVWAGMERFYRQRVAEVNQEHLTVGVAEQKIDPDGGKTVTIKTEANIWIELHDRASRRLVEVCAAAIRAGIEERQVRLAERQGELVYSVIDAILRELDLTAEQHRRVPDVVPRHLRALSGGGEAA